MTVISAPRLAMPSSTEASTYDLKLATKWLEAFVVQGLDGVVAKALDSVYRSGEREMLKVKRARTADCVVLGFRWAKDHADMKKKFVFQDWKKINEQRAQWIERFNRDIKI